MPVVNISFPLKRCLLYILGFGKTAICKNAVVQYLYKYLAEDQKRYRHRKNK